MTGRERKEKETGMNKKTFGRRRFLKTQSQNLYRTTEEKYRTHESEQSPGFSPDASFL